MTGRCDLCNEDIDPGGLTEILDHLRVMHPEVYGDGPERWPDGSPVVTVESDDLAPEHFAEGGPQ